ncbi:MAG: RNA-binding domain-containing protein [Armatimonadota bacterium]
MQKSVVLEMITNGENSGVEFKRDDIRPDQLAKAAVAFANFQGGHLLLGVEDDGSISGIRHMNLKDWVFNALRDTVHPHIIPFYEEIAFDDGMIVAVVSIASGPSKPYVLRHNRRDDVYIRLGNRSELATREQQLMLYESNGLMHVELLPVPGARFEQLDLDRIQYYLQYIVKDPEIPETQDEWVQRLCGMGLMADDGLGNRVCSVAGLVCFGIAPRKFMKQAGIHIMAFDGPDKDCRAVFDEVVDGPLVARWKAMPTGSREMVDYGLIEKMTALLTPLISEEPSTIDEFMQRHRRWLYPWDAVREVVVYALAHRDWSRNVDIEICLYSDRMEVISAGRLQNSMTVDKMIAGQRSPRNPSIVEIMRDYSYVDARGMGIRTKVIPQMRAQNGFDPEFIATDDYLKTVLRKAKP